ncbi:hypothetical protein [Agarivorans sp. DSG3-1]|uniref:hypothetical protein n=1 Tax=Agarivorans sp. DSG3-1 TaxID=3342249 RepID=UPI00398E50FE
MDIPLSFLVESLGLLIAAKLLSVNLNFVTAPLVIFLASVATYFLPTLLGVLVGFIIYIGLIKQFDGSCDYLKIIGLFVIGLVVQKGLYQLVIYPILFDSVVPA